MTFEEAVAKLTELTGKESTDAGSFIVEYFPTFQYPLGFGELGIRVLILPELRQFKAGKDPVMTRVFTIRVQLPSFPLLSAQNIVEVNALTAQAADMATRAEELVGGRNWPIS